TIKYRHYLIEFFALTSYDKHNPIGSFMDNKDGTIGNPGYINNDVRTAKMIYNQVFTLKMFFATVERSAEALIIEGKQLIELLQKEYRFLMLHATWFVFIV